MVSYERIFNGKELSKENVDIVLGILEKHYDTEYYVDPQDFEDFEIDGNTVRLEETEMSEDCFEGDGKYQHKNTELCVYGKDFVYNTVFIIDMRRSGSYFSDYYYNHNIKEPKNVRKIYIKEVIIPAHYEYDLEI